MTAFSHCCDERSSKENQHYPAFLAIPCTEKQHSEKEYDFNDNIGHINGTLFPMLLRFPLFYKSDSYNGCQILGTPLPILPCFTISSSLPQNNVVLW